MNSRRQTLIALGAGLLCAPLFARAQAQGKVWRVGFLALRRIAQNDPIYHNGFAQGMRDLGYEQGKNLLIEWRSAEGDYTRLPALAAELVQINVDVLVVAGTLATRAAQKATAAIPVVMGSTNDPVADGFVKSLGRPGGNITGIANLSPDIASKHLEMLLSMSPKLTRVAILLTPSNPSHATILDTIRAAGSKQGITVVGITATTRPDLETAFGMMVKEQIAAFIIAQDAFFIQYAPEIAAMAIKHRLPSIAAFKEYVENGGLLGYGQSATGGWRRAAVFVDKILKGAKPADLPVEQPTTLELFINGKTAKALNLKIPQSLLIMADKVIE